MGILDFFFNVIFFFFFFFFATGSPEKSYEREGMTSEFTLSCNKEQEL